MMRRFGLLQFARCLLPPLMMIVSRCLRSYSRHLTSCFSLTWRLAAALNGVDEVLDLGDDCHEVNLLSRAKLMGIGAWNLGNVAVELVEHHKWQRSHLWTRFLSSSRFGAFACLRRLHFSRPCDHPNAHLRTCILVSRSAPFCTITRLLTHSARLVLLQHESLGSHA